MPFIQVIEYRTGDIDAVKKLTDEWERTTEGKRTARRIYLTQDRNDPLHYLEVVVFDSYDSAMENSALPETQAIAEQMNKLFDGPPVYYDLDVIDERS